MLSAKHSFPLSYWVLRGAAHLVSDQLDGSLNSLSRSTPVLVNPGSCRRLDETLNLSPMEEQTAQNPRHPPLCQECKLNPSKYTCPGCSVRSCSLPCVKAHKQQTGCTGKRQQTQFVPLSQFDDTLLLSGTFFSQFGFLLSNFYTHLAILKICHE